MPTGDHRILSTEDEIVVAFAKGTLTSSLEATIEAALARPVHQAAEDAACAAFEQPAGSLQHLDVGDDDDSLKGSDFSIKAMLVLADCQTVDGGKFSEQEVVAATAIVAMATVWDWAVSIKFIPFVISDNYWPTVWRQLQGWRRLIPSRRIKVLSNLECAICRDAELIIGPHPHDFHEGRTYEDAVVMVECGHILGATCTEMWKQNFHAGPHDWTCPICRTPASPLRCSKHLIDRIALRSDNWHSFQDMIDWVEKMRVDCSWCLDCQTMRW